MKPETQRLLPAFFPLLAAFFLSPLKAAPVSIGDASFEGNSLSAGT